MFAQSADESGAATPSSGEMRGGEGAIVTGCETDLESIQNIQEQSIVHLEALPENLAELWPDLDLESYQRCIMGSSAKGA